MGRSVARKLLESRLVEGELTPGEEIGLRIDQTLTQDATGTLVMLELEAMGLDRVRTELSAQYVDHNLVQADFRNPDDHLFLRSACRKFGIWFSRPGNGVSHPVHAERFGVPGKTLLGSDSHTPSAGSMGMLAIGAGGLEVAMAMAGKPYYVSAPRIMGVRLVGSLPKWVSAKDVILEMLRRHGVAGGVGFPGIPNFGAAGVGGAFVFLTAGQGLVPVVMGVGDFVADVLAVGVAAAGDRDHAAVLVVFGDDGFHEIVHCGGPGGLAGFAVDYGVEGQPAQVVVGVRELVRDRAVSHRAQHLVRPGPPTSPIMSKNGSSASA